MGRTIPDIFLSYNREDQATAKLFVNAFEREGLTVWWDAALRSGEAYDEVTENALKTAKAVAVLWSTCSVVSRWVRSEATLANRYRTLIPAMIEPCERPIMFELTQTADLSHWRGAADDKAWRTYLADVKRLIEKDAPIQQKITPAAAPLPAPLADLRDGRPALAVLPFANRSQLEEDDVFADGMVEDVIAALAQAVYVRVLGAMATAAFKKVALTDLSALGRHLGVDYFLEGNVRRVGADLRVTTQLLKAADGTIVWSGRFDRPLAELAALQEALVLDLAAALGAQVVSAEMRRVLEKPLDLNAWELLARSWVLFRNADSASILLAIASAERLIALAPDLAVGHALLAAGRGLIYWVASPDNPDELRRIKAMIDRAIALAAPDDPLVLTSAGMVYCLLGSPEVGLAHAVQAVRKRPGDGYAYYARGMAASMLDGIDAALDDLDAAERLTPGLPWAVYAAAWRGNTLVRAGRIEEALAAYDHCLDLNPNYWPARLHKAIQTWRLGRRDEARVAFLKLKESGAWGANSAAFYRRVFSGSRHLGDILAALAELEAS
ncbi:MAG: TIR domain-containing protein [Parvularculaceae bacterium]